MDGRRHSMVLLSDDQFDSPTQCSHVRHPRVVGAWAAGGGTVYTDNRVAGCSQSTTLISLSLSLLVCGMGIILAPASLGFYED